MKKYLYLPVILILVQMSILGVEVENKKIINPKNSYTVGDRIKLEIILKKKEDEKIISIKDKTEKDIELIDSSIKRSKNRIIIKKTYQIFTLKAKSLPDLVINYQKNGTDEKLSVKGSSINIKELTDKNTKLSDIEDLKKDIETNYSIWPILGFIILLLAAGFGLYFLYKKFKIRNRSKDTAPIYLKEDIDPLEYLQENYSETPIDKYINEKKYKKLYFKITEIIRKFLSLYYRKNYIDMTVTEFKTYFDETIDKNLKKELFEFLTFADLVKFGKYKPDRDSLNNIERFMDKLISYYIEEQNKKDREESS
ncbi:MAG: hypothetical protein FXF47_01450 [Candidatus Mcinerneyibacterium aminivorans]|uniref:DUF4381 domain-containing protein n=1 Tax=Candidatus Mcinerneyibacterium aminivorans TaxID=2703815 RepID=A0A5D0MN02_9BACT|nr:MAG: hypothetical protein FXF47_01450 [Candidatus Mcinerneyibacterium aminivorans]